MKRLIRRASMIIAAAALAVVGASFATDGWEIHGNDTAGWEIHGSPDDNQWH